VVARPAAPAYLTKEEPVCAYFESEYKAVVALLIRAGASLGDAEGAAQEAMQAALRQWSSVERPKPFTRTIALRALYRTRKARAFFRTRRDCRAVRCR
jgi:predicted RNA polymerase sigma factor